MGRAISFPHCSEPGCSAEEDTYREAAAHGWARYYRGGRVSWLCADHRPKRSTAPLLEAIDILRELVEMADIYAVDLDDLLEVVGRARAFLCRIG